MAIEALNSAVSYQAQTTRQAKPVQKTVVEDTEVTTTQGKAVSGDIAAGTRVGETEKREKIPWQTIKSSSKGPGSTT